MSALAVHRCCSSCQGIGQDTDGNGCWDCSSMGGFDVETQEPVHWIVDPSA